MAAPIVVATFSRSGTHLMIDLLRNNFDECKAWRMPWESLHHLYFNLDDLSDSSPRKTSIHTAKKRINRAMRPIIKTHALPSLQGFTGSRMTWSKQQIESSIILYVIRDIRAVLKSLYIGYMSSGACNTVMTFSEFLRQSEPSGTWADPNLSVVQQWVRHISEWGAKPNVRIYQYENVIADPQSAFDRLITEVNLKAKYSTPHFPKKLKVRNRPADYWRRLTYQHESTAILPRKNGKRVRFPVGFSDQRDLDYIWSEAGPLLKYYKYDEDW